MRALKKLLAKLAGPELNLKEIDTALDVDDAAAAVYVRDLQAGQFGAPQARGIEGHQQGALKRRGCGFDETVDFFPTEDRGKIPMASPTRVEGPVAELADPPAFSFLIERLSFRGTSCRNSGALDRRGQR